MKKMFQFAAAVFFITIAANAQSQLGTDKEKNAMKTIYDYKVLDITGKRFDMKSLQGKKVIIVNTASQCGLTPQYKELQSLYSEYKDKGLVIVGFPSNDFNEQEPGSNAEIATFCSANYGVTFPMMEKITVRGEGTHELYKYLVSKELNGVADAPINWNFQKFLIDPKGRIVKSIPPQESINSPEVIEWIESK